MNIFEWADDMMWICDYHDHHTNMIYHIQDAKDHNHIDVTLDGKYVKTVVRNKDES